MTDGFTALVVDDDRRLATMLAEILRHRGYLVYTACDGQEGVEAFQSRPCNLVMLDVEMPRMEGIEALRLIRALDAQVDIIVMTGGTDPRAAAEAAHLGAEFIRKPFSIGELTALWTTQEEARSRKLTSNQDFIHPSRPPHTL